MNEFIYKFLRYLVQGLAIFLLLKFVPQITGMDLHMGNTEIIIITIIIMLIYILFENLCNLYDKKQPCVCPNPENMTNIPNPNQPNPNPNQIQPIPNQIQPISNQIQPIPNQIQPIPYPTPNNNQIQPIPNQNNNKLAPNNQNILPTKITEHEKESPEQIAQTTKHLTELDLNDIAILEIINKRRHGPGFYKYLENLRQYEKKVDNHNNNPQIRPPEIKPEFTENDLMYSDYNHLPMATGHDSRDYEYGYSYLPPSQWYPTPPFPPVCVTNNHCPVYPTYTTGTPTDVKEFNTKILPPDRINIKYADRLNN